MHRVSIINTNSMKKKGRKHWHTVAEVRHLFLLHIYLTQDLGL